MGLDPNSQLKAGRKPAQRNHSNKPREQKKQTRATTKGPAASRRRATLPRQPYVQVIYHPSQNVHVETPESWQGRRSELVRDIY
ncbi:hypothetical protein V8C44DRAFT_342239 [Trichoderma aethiopicum]